MGDLGGGGGRLSFRDADVVPFTFDLDFPEGLSFRESTADESGGKTVPAVEVKNMRKGTREEEKARKLVREKGGGDNSKVFMPATLWSQHKKSGS